MGKLPFEVDLKHRVAVVTGASGGIGYPLCIALSGAGATVLATRAKPQIRDFPKPNKILWSSFDIRDEDNVEFFVEWAIEHFSRIDILVNCAGIFEFTSVPKVTASAIDDIMDTNFRGSFMMMKYVLPHMKKAGYGRVVNISSFAAESSMPGTSVYAASKAAIEAASRVAAAEVAGKGITVNVVQPGVFDVGMVDRFDYHTRQSVLDMPPMGPGKAAQLVSPIMFLVSDDASYITGEVIRVDGGL